MSVCKYLVVKLVVSLTLLFSDYYFKGDDKPLDTFISKSKFELNQSRNYFFFFLWRKSQGLALLIVFFLPKVSQRLKVYLYLDNLKL